MHKSLAAGLTVWFLGGCAMGVKHDYQGPLELGVSTSAPVVVATLDHRPYVMNGQKAPNFVGLSRGGFGNPFDVTTQSGKPLASDISSAIVASMKGKGVDARMVELKPGLSESQAISDLRTGGAPKSVLLTLREWKGDTMVNVGFAYNMDLRVFDRSGNVLASKTQHGNENLGAGSPFSPGGGDQVLPRYRRMMELLFRDPDVVKALQP
jgi:hypothetical protein